MYVITLYFTSLSINLKNSVENDFDAVVKLVAYLRQFESFWCQVCTLMIFKLETVIVTLNMNKVETPSFQISFTFFGGGICITITINGNGRWYFFDLIEILLFLFAGFITSFFFHLVLLRRLNICVHSRTWLRGLWNLKVATGLRLLVIFFY